MAYKHIIVREFGGPDSLEVIEETDLPEPILVRDDVLP